MSFRTEEPTGSFGRMTPSKQKQASQRVKEAWSRANRRRKMAELVASVPGSLETKRLAVVRAMENQALPAGAIPAKSTVKYLVERWEAGARTVEDFMEQKRSGRPVVHLDGPFQAEVERVLRGGYGKSAHALKTEFEAASQEDATLHSPSYHAIHKQFAAAGRLSRSAARHGSRAGIVDGGPKGRVAAVQTHDIWALDEFTLPLWVGMWSDKLFRWISARCDLVLVVDLCSTFPVGYYVVDPSRRTTQDGDIRESGFDTRDVLAALLSAACPELAPDATREAAGYLPNRLQMDNHAVHKALKKHLADAHIDISYRRIPVRHAFSNGAAERPGGTIKSWFAGLEGHIDDYIPTDRLSKEQLNRGLLRTEMAGSTPERETRKIEVLPEQLPRIHDVGGMVDEVIRRFGHTHVRSLFRQTAIARYHAKMARRTPRRGHELLRTLEPRTTTVSNAGIQYVSDNMKYQFLAVIDHAIWMDDKPVTYYPDPANRGIFVEDNGTLHFLKPQPTMDELVAKRLVASRSIVSRQVSDLAMAQRKTDFIVTQGKRALAHAQEGELREKAAFEAAASGEDVPAPVSFDTTPPSRRQKPPKATLEPTEAKQPTPPPDDPWKAVDPTSFVRVKRPVTSEDNGGTNE